MQWNPSFQTNQKRSFDPHSEHCFLAPPFFFFPLNLNLSESELPRRAVSVRTLQGPLQTFSQKKTNFFCFESEILGGQPCWFPLFSSPWYNYNGWLSVNHRVTYLLSFRGPFCQCWSWTVQAKPASKCFVTFLRTAVLHGILGDKHCTGHTQRTRQAQQLYWLDPSKRFPTYCHEQLLQQQQKHESTILLLSTNQLLQTMP